MKVNVEFYADTFRHCIVDVPDDIKPRTDAAETFIHDVINNALLKNRIFPKKGSCWKMPLVTTRLLRPGKEIQFIRAKILHKEPSDCSSCAEDHEPEDCPMKKI